MGSEIRTSSWKVANVFAFSVRYTVILEQIQQNLLRIFNHHLVKCALASGIT